MDKKNVNVGKDFYWRLTNRDRYQGDGKHHAVEFRERYLSEFDNELAWKDKNLVIELDFSEVKTIIPSFANEAFAYFTKYASPEEILKHFKFINITPVKMELIKKELNNGFEQ